MPLDRRPHGPISTGDWGMGLEGAVLVPVMILGSAVIIYLGLIHARERKPENGEE